MISVFPVHFLNLKYPKHCALMKEGVVILASPPPPMHFKSLNFMLLGKEVLEKTILVLGSL